MHWFSTSPELPHLMDISSDSITIGVMSGSGNKSTFISVFGQMTNAPPDPLADASRTADESASHSLKQSFGVGLGGEGAGESDGGFVIVLSYVAKQTEEENS